MPARPRALLVVESFPPYTFSGPAQSTGNLVTATSEAIAWTVLARSRVARGAPPEGDYELVVFRTIRELFVHMWRLLARGSWNLVLVNSMFAPSTQAALMLSAGKGLTSRVVIMPRGELHAGALAFRRRKKLLFLKTCRFLGLPRRVTFAATSQEEASDVARYFPEARCRLLPNIPINPAMVRPIEVLGTPTRAPLRLIFNSRASQKKGLDLAIAGCRESGLPLTLDVFASVDSSHARLCRQLADVPDGPVHIHWRTPLPVAELLDLMRGYDAMLLPTAGENFGHSIFEAMAVGLPVLIPDTTPWTQSVLGGAGVLLAERTPAAIARALHLFSGLTPAERRSMSSAARLAATEYYRDGELVEAVRAGLLALASS